MNIQTVAASPQYTQAAVGRTWKCSLYLRLSKEDGDKAESDSISNQRELITNYLKGISNIQIVSERIDDGFSGASFQRPAFLAMMEDIKAGTVDCVVVKDLSRFGRNYTEAGKYLENVFPFMGVRFLSVNDGIDSTAQKSYGDNIIIPFKNLVNDAYCRDISVKIRSQLEIKRKKGDFIGSFAVYGYLKDENDKNKLVVDEYAAAVVRDIYKWKIEGMSGQGIADRLNELGILSPLEYKKFLGLKLSTSFKRSTQAKWSAVAVSRILRDEIFVGVLAQGKTSTPNHKVQKNIRKSKKDWVRAFNNHEPIISQDEFELVGGLLSKDMRISPNANKVYLFSGILRCGDCGGSMVRKTVPSGGKNYHYYVCGDSKKRLCTAHAIREDKLIGVITETMQTHIQYILNIERILSFIDTLPLKQDEVQKLDGQIIRKKEEIQRYKDYKISLYESMVNGLIDETEYHTLKKQFTDKYEEAERALLALGKEIENILNCKGEKNYWIEQFKTHQNFTELTRTVVVSLIDEIRVFEDNRIDICFKYQTNLENALSFVLAVNGINPLDELDQIKGAM